MKLKKNKLIFALIIALSFIANSCTDLTVENLNEPSLLNGLAPTKIYKIT